MPTITTVLTYEEWMAQVDSAVGAMAFGLSVHDLPDFLSRDMFDDGATPEEAAREALEGADFPFE